MTESQRLDLVFHSIDSGFCRVYYKTKKPAKGWSYLYCFQNGAGSSFSLYQCSSDGEPSHEIPIDRAGFIDEPPRDDKIGEMLYQWIKNLKK